MNTASFYLIIQNWWDFNKKKWSSFLTGEESLKKHRGEKYNGIVEGTWVWWSARNIEGTNRIKGPIIGREQTLKDLECYINQFSHYLGDNAEL